jgi:hypothetical protein
MEKKEKRAARVVLRRTLLINLDGVSIKREYRLTGEGKVKEKLKKRAVLEGF